MTLPAFSFPGYRELIGRQVASTGRDADLARVDVDLSPHPRGLSDSRWSTGAEPAIVHVRGFSFMQARRLAAEHFGAGGKRTSGTGRSLEPWGEHDLVDVELVVDPNHPDMGVAGVIRIEPLKR